jgi:hypothetical protein
MTDDPHDFRPPATRPPDVVAIPRPDPPARLLGYRPWDRPGSLHAHCDVDISGFQFFRVPIFVRADGTWSVGVPSAPELDGEGRHRIDENGKRLYWPLLKFSSRERRQRWERLVLNALADAGITP